MARAPSAAGWATPSTAVCHTSPAARAFGNVRANVTSRSGLFSVERHRVGWTVGAGLEYAFLGNWTAKIEYLYVDLGSFDTGFTAPIRNNVSFKENIVRAGLNYKFSGPIFTRW